MSQTDISRRRRVLHGIGALIGGSLITTTATADDHDAGNRETDPDKHEGGDHEGEGDGQFCLPDDDGLVTVEGGDSFDETVAAIEAAIKRSDFMLIETVDHAENAASVGKDLRPTTLLIFGNPRAGTPLMQENQTTGIDLPQKLLVWCDEDNTVNVTYNDPEYLAARHGLEENDEIIEMGGKALAMLAESGHAGSGKDDGTATGD